MGRNKKPLSYKRINLLGRKRYSEDGEALLVIESCFDDCWSAIWKLWAAVILLIALCICVVCLRGWQATSTTSIT